MAWGPELVSPAPGHRLLLLVVGLTMPQPPDEDGAIGMPGAGPHLGPTPCFVVYINDVVLCTPHSHLPKEAFSSTFQMRKLKQVCFISRSLCSFYLYTHD